MVFGGLGFPQEQSKISKININIDSLNLEVVSHQPRKMEWPWVRREAAITCSSEDFTLSSQNLLMGHKWRKIYNGVMGISLKMMMLEQIFLFGS